MVSLDLSTIPRYHLLWYRRAEESATTNDESDEQTRMIYLYLPEKRSAFSLLVFEEERCAPAKRKEEEKLRR